MKRKTIDEITGTTATKLLKKHKYNKLDAWIEAQDIIVNKCPEQYKELLCNSEPSILDEWLDLC